MDIDSLYDLILEKNTISKSNRVESVENYFNSIVKKNNLI